jgi:hypothetical protein
MKREDITTNVNEIQKFMRDYFENLYSNKVENLEELEKFLNALDLPKLNQENIKHLSCLSLSQYFSAVLSFFCGS